uniref:Uncharacterized protein n=1 Tax=Timema tahoe TaxID=61484 RepID=A0A7R9FJQ1_9NEOP|nr:unnamed protein product [Timema tahoe]
MRGKQKQRKRHHMTERERATRRQGNDGEAPRPKLSTEHEFLSSTYVTLFPGIPSDAWCLQLDSVSLRTQFIVRGGVIGDVLPQHSIIGRCLIHCESSAALDHVATEVDPVASEVDPNVAYCFQFTWMGPSYDNSTTNNSTCSDITFEACKKPLVVTNDQTPPNTTTLWENYNSHVACKMAKGHVCAKWIYSFSGAESIVVLGCPFTGVGRGGKVSAGAPDPGERAWFPLSLEVYHRLSNPDDVIYFGSVIKP